MTEDEARTIYEKFCRETQRPPTSSSPRPQLDGSWRFVESEGAGPNGTYEGVVVRADRRPFSFGGALGTADRQSSSS
jgi:hypothetical protein